MAATGGARSNDANELRCRTESRANHRERNLVALHLPIVRHRRNSRRGYLHSGPRVGPCHCTVAREANLGRYRRTHERHLPRARCRVRTTCDKCTGGATRHIRAPVAEFAAACQDLDPVGACTEGAGRIGQRQGHLHVFGDLDRRDRKPPRDGDSLQRVDEAAPVVVANDIVHGRDGQREGRLRFGRASRDGRRTATRLDGA